MTWIFWRFIGHRSLSIWTSRLQISTSVRLRYLSRSCLLTNVMQPEFCMLNQGIGTAPNLSSKNNGKCLERGVREMAYATSRPTHSIQKSWKHCHKHLSSSDARRTAFRTARTDPLLQEAWLDRIPKAFCFVWGRCGIVYTELWRLWSCVGERCLWHVWLLWRTRLTHVDAAPFGMIDSRWDENALSQMLGMCVRPYHTLSMSKPALKQA